MRHLIREYLIALFLFCCVTFAIGQMRSVDGGIPPELKEWRSWVLKGYEHRVCPFIVTQYDGDRTSQPSDGEADAQNYLCAWPGKLLLDVSEQKAEFSQQWRVESAEWIPLPGYAELWPQEVTVNGQRLPVLTNDDAPAIWLEPGNYEVRGHILWSERPQSLAVPSIIGLIGLKVDGKDIIPLERDENSVTLGRVTPTAPQAEALTLKVFRKITDGLPSVLETQLEFDVAGPGREAVIGPVLPEGFVPLAIQGSLPARLDADGKLHIQLRPGSWQLQLSARAVDPLTKLIAAPAPEPWPEQEIWSYAATPALRVTNASSELSIDPAQAGVPQAWRALPAFAMGKEAVLTVEERSRGLASTDANRLHLQREAWLDFSGAEWFAKDRISGRMVRDWRLEVMSPFALTRAEADGEGLLITARRTDQDHPLPSGVEVRNPNVNLSAGVRVEARRGSLPITGWQQTFDSMNLTLHLPYGYRLLAAPGADGAQGTWISRWTLLDIFLCAMVALFAWRLFGWLGAAVVAFYLLLAYHEPGVPFWIVGISLVLGLLAKVLPPGKLASVNRWLGYAVLLILVLASLPFAAMQIRSAIYPQLERAYSVTNGFSDSDIFGADFSRQYDYRDGLVQGRFRDQVPSDEVQKALGQDKPVVASSIPEAPPPVVAEQSIIDGSENEPDIETETVTGSRAKIPTKSVLKPNIDQAAQNAPNNIIAGKAQNLRRYAEKLNIQAGRGEPGWQYGSTYGLSWQGPITSNQTVHLVIAPPWVVRGLRLVIVGLLAFIIFNLLSRYRVMSPKAIGSHTPSIAGFFLLASSALIAPHSHAADYPPKELLDELRTRVIETSHCASDCAVLSRAWIRTQGDALQIALEAQTGERVALPLPVDDKNLILKSISMDGAAQQGVVRQDGHLLLAVGRGVHRIELTFVVLETDKISLSFPLKPTWIEFADSDEWDVSGLSENQLLTEVLEIVRVREAGTEPTRGSTQQFPPYVQLTRNVRLDLDWEIDNEVYRHAPAEGGFSIDLPLLKDEHVTTAQLKVKDNRITVPLPDGASSATWSSQLDKSDVITLTAPPLANHTEVWKIVQSPTWHVEFSGVPAVQSPDSGKFWVHEFHPLPGETLTVTINRPEPVSGSSLAIDGVTLNSQISARSSQHTLNLTLRSTQGGEHVIDLPVDAEVLSVIKYGQTVNLRPREGKLSLPVTPGSQNFAITWRENHEMTMRATTPSINLNNTGANIMLNVNLPSDRWLLASSGPTVGPAVLYWGELIVMILLAFVLSRLRRTSLKFWQWLLLGIGFSTFSWVALMVVVGWLLIMDWRARNPIQHDGLFNLTQIGLVVLTLIALLCVAASIPYGLLGNPDMHIMGHGSSSTQLHWFADQSISQLPQGIIISLPLWVYRTAMLIWALWLANAVFGWLRWSFAVWSQGGYWRSEPKSTSSVSAQVTHVDEANKPIIS